MKKVVFLGAKDIGEQCLRVLFERQENLDFKLIAVGTSVRGNGVREFASVKRIPIIEDLNELLSLEFDILFSVQYHAILKKEHIECAKEIAFNLHLAPLPEYRGCNQFSFAILNEDREFGATIHRLECGIDSGDIVFEKRFEIPRDCFVDELVELANEAGFKLFCENLEKMLKGEYVLTPQNCIKTLRREFHLRNEIEALKCVDLQAAGGGALIEKIIRATAMPGFEPPYCHVGKRKFYFLQAKQD